MAKKKDDKRLIQNRMYKEAAVIYEQYTGKKLSRLEGFDPLVYMLIGACASEFDKLSQEVQSSWARMLEHLTQLLIPEVHTGATPAQAILHAQSELGTSITKPDTEFAVYQTYEGEEIDFSPTGKFKIWSGDVQFMASSNSLFLIDDDLSKNPLFKSTSGQPLPPYDIWLGVALQEETDSLKNLRFFFDWPSEFYNTKSREILSASTISLNGKKLDFDLGLFEEEETEQSISGAFHLIRKLEQSTNSFFGDNFVSCQSDEPLTHFQKEICPMALKSCFSEEEIATVVTEPLYWIKISLSPAFFSSPKEAKTVNSKIRCLLNCVPVVNRKLISKNFNLNTDINLFQLDPEGYFLAIENVISSRLMHHYLEKPFTEIFDEEKVNKGEKIRTYSIRKEGVNRFDKRDAIAVIENLLRYMREEAFIFSALGRDVISNNIKAINRALNDIERKISQKKKEEGITDQPGIFIAFPPGHRENVLVRFWSTKGFLANNIPSGENLRVRGDTPWVGASLRLVTKTAGGRNTLGEKDRLYEFKSALISRDKIVTKEDIRLYCFTELGDDIHEMEVKPGVKLSANRQEGLIRTLDVHIALSDHFSGDEELRLLNCRKIENYLNEHSSIILPIRIFLLQEQETDRELVE